MPVKLRANKLKRITKRPRKTKDVLTEKQRSYCMSMIRSKDTKIEVAVQAALRLRGHKFRKHAEALPGRPDIYFPKLKVAIFIDGDFWHGYRFTSWSGRLSPTWKAKISGNMKRDKRNFRLLRAQGWNVLRVWESQVAKNLDSVITKIEMTLRENAYGVD